MNYVEMKRIKRITFHSLISELKKSSNYIITDNKFWLCFSPRNISLQLPSVGLKIHLSATLNNATDILDKFWHYIQHKNIAWKVIQDFRDLERQNLGYNGYSQIGKFITIYPSTQNELLQLLQDLEIIYKPMKSISIPSDYSYMNSQVVYYRYGDIQNEGSTESKYVDKRNRTIPNNVTIPIDDYFIPHFHELPSRLYLCGIHHISGKSSVYTAINLEAASTVILKEASPLHDLDIHGVDAINRLHHEKIILKKISKFSFAPKFLSDFYIDDHYFLVMSKLPGESLFSLLKNGGKLSIKQILFIIRKIICIVHTLQKQGIQYSDISLTNVLFDQKSVYLVDYEYCQLNSGLNLPEILAGALGFYPIEYPFNDIKRTIYAIAALLLNIEFFDDYSRILYQDSENDMYKRIEDRFYKSSYFNKIYDKAFTFNYTNLSEFLAELKSTVRHYTSE